MVWNGKRALVCARLDIADVAITVVTVMISDVQARPESPSPARPGPAQHWACAGPGPGWQ
jgi:hypothetical protein